MSERNRDEEFDDSIYIEPGIEDENEADHAEGERADYEAEMRAQFEAAMPSPSELAEMNRSHEEFQRREIDFGRLEAELDEYHVEYNRPSREDISALISRLAEAHDEEDVQKFLADNPHLIAWALGWGHQVYVLPKPKLGSEFVPDFLVARTNSMGVKWVAVELEPVTMRMFIKNGQASANLTHAVQQVIDWRAWLTANMDYARRPVAENGLGLVGIEGNIPGMVLMGRRGQYPKAFNSYRNQMDYNMNISIQSYDWLLDMIQSNLPQSQ